MGAAAELLTDTDIAAAFGEEPPTMVPAPMPMLGIPPATPDQFPPSDPGMMPPEMGGMPPEMGGMPPGMAPPMQPQMIPQVGAYTQLWMSLVGGQSPSKLYSELDCTVEAGSARKPNREEQIGNVDEMAQVLVPAYIGYHQATGDAGPLNNFISRWAKSRNEPHPEELHFPPPPTPPGMMPGGGGPPQGGGGPPDEGPPQGPPDAQG
jgi:hypothetical protein